MDVMPLPKVTDDNIPQSKNADSDIVVTESGMVTEVRLTHFSNAFSPMTFNPLLKVTVLRLDADINADLPISRTLLPSATSVSDSQ